MIATADTVLFAIQAGLKLYGGVRKAYVDSTRSRALLLPLPRAADVDAGSARVWFLGDGASVAAQHPRIQWLVNKSERTGDEERELLASYSLLYSEANPIADPDRLPDVVSADELGAILTIRQWQVDEPGAPRSALQQVAGTIVNIVVDYFANTPGAVSERRPTGRLLLAFMRTLDKIDLAETPPRQLIGDILVGVLDGISAHPDVIGGGELEQSLIANIGASLATSAATILGSAAPSIQVDSASAWLQVIARAIVDGGARTIISNPVRFLGVEEGGQVALVQAVGTTLTELLLADEHKLTFRTLLSGDGVTKVAQAALGAIAANPDLLKVDHQGLKAILVALAGDLSKYDAPFASDFFPELARLVLERTADNLDLVWGPKFKSPDRHLLVKASRSLLKALVKKPKAGATWKPTLTQAQVLGVLEDVFDEVVENPDWLVARANDESDTLGAAVEAMLDAMRGFDGARISADAGLAMFRAGILAVGQRIELLDSLPAGGKDAGRVALTAVVEIVIAAILSDRDAVTTNWRLARNSTLQILVEVALQEVAAHGASQDDLDAVRKALADLVAGKFSLPAFREQLVKRLAA